MERALVKSDRLDTTHPPAANHGSIALDELLTVDEVAALLKVSKSWIYEHTHSRGVPRTERLPCITLGKYVRFEPESVRAYLASRLGNRVGGRL